MQQIGTISALVENGFTYYDTKLKADTTVYRYTSADNRADYITDYDFYIDTDNETFRLPLLNGSEDLPSDNFTSFGISSLDTTGYTFTASCNGYVFFTGWQSNITAGLLITVNNHLRWFSGLATANQTFRPTCYLFVNKGDVVHVYGEKGTISINTPSIDFGFYKAQGNGSLYYYVGETVQNANLIDAGRIGEILPTKTDMQQASGAGMPSSKYIDLTLGASGSAYTAPANGWFRLVKTPTKAGEFILFSPLKYYSGQPNTDMGNVQVAGNWLNALPITIPVLKGDQIFCYYNFTGETVKFEFRYAEGEI